MQRRDRVPWVRAGLVGVVCLLVWLALPGAGVAAGGGERPVFAVGDGALARGAGYGRPAESVRVRALQGLLARRGWRPGPVDGLFGPLTEAAVVRFQAAAGLAADGVVGAETGRALRALARGDLRRGAGFARPAGSARVRQLQRRLARTGFSPGAVDGLFGPRTERAVARLQAAGGVAASGVANGAARRLLANPELVTKTGGRGDRGRRRRSGESKPRAARPETARKPAATKQGRRPSTATGGQRQQKSGSQTAQRPSATQQGRRPSTATGGQRQQKDGSQTAQKPSATKDGKDTPRTGDERQAPTVTGGEPAPKAGSETARKRPAGKAGEPAPPATTGGEGEPTLGSEPGVGGERAAAPAGEDGSSGDDGVGGLFWLGLALAVVGLAVILWSLLTLMRRRPPAPQQPAAVEPTPTQPTPTQAAAKEPALEEPAAKQPALEEPAAEEPALDEPAPDEPAPVEPALEEAAAEEPALEEPALEEPAAKEPALDEPALDEPAFGEPVPMEPALEEPALEEPALAEPAFEEPALEEPALEEPALEEPAFEEPALEEPALEEPALGEPAVVDESVVVLADGLVAEGHARDRSVGWFSGRVVSIGLVRGGVLRRRRTRYLVDDPDKPEPFWVGQDEVARLVSPTAPDATPDAGGRSEPEVAGKADAAAVLAAANGASVRVLGYVSVPAGEPLEGERLRSQSAAIDALCERRGWRLVELVTDVEGAPGRALERPGLAYALERVANRDAGCLVVAELRRLSGSVAELGRLLEQVYRNGGRLVALDLEIDTALPAGRRAANALVSVAAWQREQQPQPQPEHAAAGGGGGGRPAWHNVPALKGRIAAMRAQGLTLQAIADQLNQEGVPTLRGGAKWRPSSVQAATGYRRPNRRYANQDSKQGGNQ